MKAYRTIVSVICFSCISYGVTPAIASSDENESSGDEGNKILFKKGVDYCWNFENYTLPAEGKYRVAFSHLGNSHYLMSGVATVTSPIQKKFPVFGNAEMVDGEIIMTISLAGIRNGVIGNDMKKVRFNPSTLNGPFESIGVYYDAVEISEGDFWHTGCQ